MTEEQANDIITNTMKVHWPKWEFIGEELFVWIRELRKFDYELAKESINDLYVSWDSNRYPKMPHIMGAIRKRIHSQRQANKRIAALFVITKQDGTRRWSAFFGDINSPKEEIERRAEALREEANRLWADEQHIIHHLNTDEEEDTGYYGPNAKKRAIDSIWAGPDTKTKRWLELYLKRKKLKPNIPKNNEPVPVGDVIPF